MTAFKFPPIDITSIYPFLIPEFFLGGGRQPWLNSKIWGGHGQSGGNNNDNEICIRGTLTYRLRTDRYRGVQDLATNTVHFPLERVPLLQ